MDEQHPRVLPTRCEGGISAHGTGRIEGTQRTCRHAGTRGLVPPPAHASCGQAAAASQSGSVALERALGARVSEERERDVLGARVQMGARGANGEERTDAAERRRPTQQGSLPDTTA